MYRYIPSGVCSRGITFDIIDGKVRNVHFTGGCPGNTQGVAILAEGHTPEELIGLLEGVQCGAKGTSCPDQFAKALKESLKQA